MLSGLTRLVLKIKWSFNVKYEKKCKGLCVTCPYFDICVCDVILSSMVEDGKWPTEETLRKIVKKYRGS